VTAQVRGVALRRAGSLVCATLAFAPALTAQSAPTAPNGWSFQYEMSTMTTTAQPVPAADMLLNVEIWRGNARITVKRGALQSLTGSGGMILLRAGDTVLTIVKPDRREVLLVNPGELSAIAGGSPSGPAFDVTNVSSTVTDRGAARPVFGYAARSTELMQRFTVRLSTSTIRRELVTQQKVNLVVSDAIARVDPGFKLFAMRFARGFGQPAAVRRALAPFELRVPAGFPVMTGTLSRVVSGTDTLETNTLVRVLALQRAVIDTTLFAVPADYRVTEMSRLLQNRRPPPAAEPSARPRPPSR
jgi:hypothetical protein